MKKNKIGLISTHNVNNYGAILQTFALSKILSNYGTTKIINYDNKHISSSMRLLRIRFSVKGILGFIKDLFRLLPRYRVIKKFKQFQKSYMVLTEKMDSENINFFDFNNFTHMVAGSDQIWNPACISKNCKIDQNYFLQFAKYQKKISYAPSLGNYIFSNYEKEIVRKYLREFKSISVREKDGKTQLENILSQKIKHVLDPTLLLDKEDWVKTIDLKENKKDYILAYSVPKTKLMKQALHFFSKKLSLPIISIDQDPFISYKSDRHINDAGPTDFLNLFLNAKFIITDSFHGACFSVNFNKDFIIISPNESLRISPNRITNFLDIVNLSEREVKSTSDFSKIKISINYKEHNELLIKSRKLSIDFLNHAINN